MADNRVPYFVIGLGLGAAAGLLVAPNRGAQTRAELRKAADEGRDFVTKRSSELRKMAEVAVDKGKEAAEEQRANLESAFQAGMDAYRSAAGERW